MSDGNGNGTVAATSVKSSQRRRGPGRPFQKGQSGNPAGRAKTMTVQLRYEVLEFFSKRYKGTTRLKHLIRRLYEEDPKTLLAYGFGKPVETHELHIEAGEGLIDPKLIAAAMEVRKLCERN